MHYPSLSSLLNRYSERVVVFATSNGGNAPLARNLALSCKQNGVPLVFFGVDAVALSALRLLATTVDYRGSAKGKLQVAINAPEDAQSITDYSFRSLAWLRYGILIEILKSNRLAIYLDTDVVVRSNFVPDILSYFEANSSLDAVIQMNHTGSACTGFFAFHPRSRKKAARIYSERHLRRKNYLALGALADQDFWNHVVCPQSGRHLLNAQLLSRDLYPNGAFFYQNAAQLETSVLKIVHYNNLIGQDAKVQRMTEHGDWLDEIAQ